MLEDTCFRYPPTLPAGTACGTSVPFLITDPGKFTDNQFTANWDREFRGGKDRLSERFFWSNSDTFEPFGADSFGIQTGGLPGTNNLNFPLDIPLHSRFGSITETHVFNNNLINDFRFGVNIISDKLNNEAPVTGAQIGINLPTATGVNGQAGDPNMYRLQFDTFGFGRVSHTTAVRALQQLHLGRYRELDPRSSPIAFWRRRLTASPCAATCPLRTTA